MPEAVGQFALLFLALRHELVQRRIEQADGDRQAVHGFQGRLDVALDEREELGQRFAALLGGLAEDHLAQQEERLIAALAVEHVLGAEQADAFGAEGAGAWAHPRACRHWCGRPCVRNLSTIFMNCWKRGFSVASIIASCAGVDIAPGAVQRDPVAFLERLTADGHGLGVGIDVRCRRRRRCSTCPSRGPRAPRGWSCRRVPVRMPSAARMPSTSSGLVSSRTG